MFVVLSILVTGFVFAFAEYDRLQDDILQNQTEQTNHISQLFSSYLERYRIFSYNLLADANVQAVLISEDLWNEQMAHVSREMTSTCNNDAFVQSIMLYNQRYLKFTSQQPNLILTESSYQHIYDRALEGTQLQFTTNASIYPDKSILILSLLQPFDRQRGIAFNLNLTALMSSLFPQESGMTLALVAPYGNSLCSTDDMNESQQDAVFHYMNGGTDHGGYILTSSPVKGTDYSIICLQEGHHGIFHNKSFQRATIATLFLLLILLALATYGAYRLARPVDDLTNAITRYADTPADQRIPIEQVTESAHKMIAEQQSMKQQLGDASWRSILTTAGMTIQGKERLLFSDVHGLREEHLILLLHFCFKEQDGIVPVSMKLIIGVLESALQDTLGNHFFHKVISLSEEEYAVVLREIEGDAGFQDVGMLEQTTLLREAVQSVLAEPMIMICSDISASEDYGQTLREMQKILRYRVIDGDNWTCLPGMLEGRRNDSVPDSIGNAVLSAVYSQDVLGLEEIIDQYIRKLQKYRLNKALSSIAHLLTEADMKTCEMLNEKAVSKEIYMDHIQRLSEIKTQHNLCNYIIEVCTRTIQALREKQEATHKDMLEDVFDYIKRNLGSSELSVQSVARYFHMSSSYFSRLFNSATEQSFPQYVNELRLEKGKNLLLSTELDIKNIAEDVGFNSSSYFCVLFQKKYGLSPSKYRIKL